MIPEKDPVGDMLNRLSEFAMLAAGKSLLKQTVTEAGFEYAEIPHYPYPVITISSPAVFDGKALLRDFLLDATRGLVVPQLPTFIRTAFINRYQHSNGDVRTGFGWSTNDLSEDPLSDLAVQLQEGNPLCEVALAWGENPHDPRGEICDATITLCDLKTEQRIYERDLLEADGLGNPNNSQNFAELLRKHRVFNWFTWARIYPKNDSDTAAQLAVNLVQRMAASGLKGTMTLYADDIMGPDTFDHEEGVVIPPAEFAGITVEEIVEKSKRLMRELSDYRSHDYPGGSQT